MATQILIRSKDLAHALNLSTLIDGETQILRSRENGIEIFEILDPNALVQLVVRPHERSYNVLNDEQSSVDETSAPKQDIVVEPTASQPPKNLALVRATAAAYPVPVGASAEKVAYPRPIKFAGRNDEMKNSPIDAHLKLKSSHTCPERNLQKKSPKEPYTNPKSYAAKINSIQKQLLKQHARPAKPNLQESKWNTRYHELVKYKRQSGNCIVPKNYDEAPNLHDWVETQRLYFRKGIIKEDRLKKLNDLGFCWNVKELTWNTRYSELMVFRRENGHTKVPQKFDPNPSLGHWVIHQRKFFRTGMLKADRIAKLNEIGFSWDGRVDGEKNYDSVLESLDCGGGDAVENMYEED